MIPPIRIIGDIILKCWVAKFTSSGEPAEIINHIILSANKKINQALCGAALSLGANIEIKDIPGFAPHINSVGLSEVAKEAFKIMFPEREILVCNSYSTGSTDMGDLSCIMPVVHPYMGGAKGKIHGSDYEIYDPQSACVDSAKWQLAMLSLFPRRALPMLSLRS